MVSRRMSRAALLLGISWVLIGATSAVAQFGGGGGGARQGGGFGGGQGGQGGQGGGGNQGGGGGFGGAVRGAGVVVDADGVLRLQMANDPTGALTRQRIQAAQAALGAKLGAKSPLRKVSLQRLEQAVADQLAGGGKPSDEMRYLAGLTRVQYLFFYPETGDLVIAGPAEAWVEDLSGRVRGMQSGRPVVELQDLVVALRTFSPTGTREQFIGCSIDPTQEGLARMQQFLRSLGSRAVPSQTNYIVQGLRNSLGLQTVRVVGVPPDTHFAQVMVEADYRMKLIGIGLERPPIKLASYVDAASPAQVSRNALQRWYFMPDYNCVRVSEDKLAMELVGQGVKLVGEDEVVSTDGARKQTGSAGNRASKAFTSGFTQRYEELSAVAPVYAQLRNLIDLAVLAAHLRQQNLYRKANWPLATFGEEAKFAVETYRTPLQVETAVTSVWRGNTLMTPVGGGVEIRAEQALDSQNLLSDEGAKLQGLHQQIDLKHLKAGQWWWD